MMAAPQISQRVLGVMSKYWTPGKAKTRLGQSIGSRRSAEIHRQFVLHLARSLAETADRRVFSIAPAHSLDDFRRALSDDAWDMMPQPSGDLGRRMRAWFEHSLPQPNGRNTASVLIGTDCPTLTSPKIDDAFAVLASHDVVLGPARDGGYYLIGLRGPWQDSYAELFEELPWSTDQVYGKTTKRLEVSGLTWAALPVCEDVDTIEDLQRLRDELAGSDDLAGAQLLSKIDSILHE